MLGALGRTADGTVGEIIAGWRHAYSYDGLSGVADVNMLYSKLVLHSAADT